MNFTYRWSCSCFLVMIFSSKILFIVAMKLGIVTLFVFRTVIVSEFLFIFIHLTKSTETLFAIYCCHIHMWCHLVNDDDDIIEHCPPGGAGC